MCVLRETDINLPTQLCINLEYKGKPRSHSPSLITKCPHQRLGLSEVTCIPELLDYNYLHVPFIAYTLYYIKPKENGVSFHCLAPRTPAAWFLTAIAEKKQENTRPLNKQRALLVTSGVPGRYL